MSRMGDARQPIRLLIADDHPLVRNGLRDLLELEPGFTVAGEAADGFEAVQQVKDLRPDVLLLDLSMPRMNGMEVLRALADAVTPVKTVVLTGAIEHEETLEVLRLGARGVILKESSAKLLYECVRAVVNGETWVGRECIAGQARSPRQVEPPCPQEPCHVHLPKELGKTEAR